MTDTAKIAKGLSEAQRESILNAADKMSNHGDYPFFTVRLTKHPWPMGIAEFMTLKTDRLTPLGLAVRQYLMENRNE